MGKRPNKYGAAAHRPAVEHLGLRAEHFFVDHLDKGLNRGALAGPDRHVKQAKRIIPPQSPNAAKSKFEAPTETPTNSMQPAGGQWDAILVWAISAAVLVVLYHLFKHLFAKKTRDDEQVLRQSVGA
jgi:hypothetical protein